jgi:hypothetical protein
MATVGLLHPGAMGATIGRAVRGEVLWCPEGRSEATRRRAEGFAGVFVDANAISPMRSARLGSAFGGRFVDGGIIGGAGGQVSLYLLAEARRIDRAALAAPDGLARGAADAFARWEADKDTDLPVDTVLEHLRA